MIGIAISPKDPKNIIEPQKWLFEHLRSFLALFAFWTVGSAFWHSQDLQASMHASLLWGAIVTFVLVAGALSIAYVLQTADLLLYGAYQLLRKLNLLRFFSERAIRWVALIIALPAFAGLCALGVAVILAPFYPELIPFRLS